MNWFDGYALARMQELWVEHLASSEALLQQSNAAMRRQHREMLKVSIMIEPVSFSQTSAAERQYPFLPEQQLSCSSL